MGEIELAVAHVDAAEVLPYAMTAPGFRPLDAAVPKPTQDQVTMISMLTAMSGRRAFRSSCQIFAKARNIPRTASSGKHIGSNRWPTV
ncbi:hypothetical protein PYR71_18945 [Rhizobium sp. MC63]|uniref:Uncharacterized protein n=1 Tax=Rhizobium mulingense TaxID=3031128 RepID=A0ACC6N3H7_9HYPH|nr:MULTISPECIES: hypothetical protein [unclassified Rhizobium]MDF0698548.1 hypothetical protein [Rhizobium sp. MC63]MEA3520144.1 hypothetical protein [Rhizobium sp. MJ31]MEB3045281.1 hypothetical protein [Rhizobium sp. MJ21]